MRRRGKKPLAKPQAHWRPKKMGLAPSGLLSSSQERSPQAMGLARPTNQTLARVGHDEKRS